MLLALFVLGACEDPEPEPEEIKGCMDAASLTYNADATVDDGSCMYAEDKQRSLFIKYTGTWCWACGDYGASIVKEMKGTHGDDIVTIEIHKGSSDPMNNAIADAWTAHWQHSATPSFVANSTLFVNTHPVSPGNAEINAHNSTDPEVLLHNEFTSTGETISGTAYIQAAQDLTADYNLGVYVLGQGFVYKQIGKDGSAHPEWDFDETTATYPEYQHEDILHAEVNSEAFGSPALTTGNTANTSQTIEYSFSPEAGWAPEVDIVLIAWKDLGNGQYEFVNIKKYEQ